MKKLFIAAAAILCFASCTKNTARDYICDLETFQPEGVANHWKSQVVFYGTYAEMKAYEAAHNYTRPSGYWQKCACK